VGPDSSGSKPGPACYGRGGQDPTVTDADLLLGYLDAGSFLGGEMKLDLEAARSAMKERIADKLGMTVAQAAWGIHNVVNETMAAAARVHIAEKGQTARNLTLIGPLKVSTVLVVATAVVLLLQVAVARRTLLAYVPPEIDAAQTEAAFLRERLAPDEAVLAMTTSYWSWFTGRPSVYLVIADEPRFDDAMRRLKVRWAALPTSRLPEFAARYPGGALPRSLVYDHADSVTDVTVFSVHPEAQP